VHAAAEMTAVRDAGRGRRPPTHRASLCASRSQLGTHIRGKRKREEMSNLMRKAAKK
jgi:hypothetical protein